MEDPVMCKCGGTPEVYTQFPVQKQMYKGEVECKQCGAYVIGVQWHWTEDDAAKEAIEAWNEKMEENNDR